MKNKITNTDAKLIKALKDANMVRLEIFITKDSLEKLKAIGHSESTTAIASLLLEQKLNEIKPNN